MIPEDVRDLIQQGEGDRLQFKEEHLRASDFAETFVAFANTHGGIVLVGVSTHGQVTGVHDWEALELRLRDVALQNCRPPVRIDIRHAELLEGEVAVVHVLEEQEKPHHAGAALQRDAGRAVQRPWGWGPPCGEPERRHRRGRHPHR